VKVEDLSWVLPKLEEMAAKGETCLAEADVLLNILKVLKRETLADIRKRTRQVDVHTTKKSTILCDYLPGLRFHGKLGQIACRQHADQTPVVARVADAPAEARHGMDGVGLCCGIRLHEHEAVAQKVAEATAPVNSEDASRGSCGMVPIILAPSDVGTVVASEPFKGFVDAQILEHELSSPWLIRLSDGHARSRLQSMPLVGLGCSITITPGEVFAL